jgi:hypothetical protein
MCGVQPIRPRLVDAGEETTDREPLAEREEPLQQTALVHHLDAAHVQAERADNPGRLRLLLQNARGCCIRTARRTVPLCSSSRCLR